MTLIDLLTKVPPEIPVGAGYVHRCEDDIEVDITTGATEKTCNYCKETKPVHSFYRNAERDSYGNRCIPCVAIVSKENRRRRLARESMKNGR